MSKAMMMLMLMMMLLDAEGQLWATKLCQLLAQSFDAHARI